MCGGAHVCACVFVCVCVCVVSLQMMWLNSKSVGCEAAIANLTSSTPVTGIPLPGQSMQCLAIVCTYDPPGNTPLLADVFIKNVRPEVRALCISYTPDETL